jgi:hypothetical protein
VTVHRTGAVVYGFQLSAVSDSTKAQAGTFTKQSGENLNSSAGIQYLEHSLPSGSGVFSVAWKAPADSSFGTVRFNLAGNAANGDGFDTGDFIYTRIDRVSPVAAAPTPQITSLSSTPTPPVANQSFTFTITGTNFDAATVTPTLTGPGCPACQSAVNITSRTTTQITGTATLAAGSYSVTVQNATGSASNAAAFGVTTAVPFAITNFSGQTQATDGSGNTAIGYARIQPVAGQTAPAGVLIFGYRPSGVLITESGVPASPGIMQGRIYANVSPTSGPGAVDTGIAIVNANSTDATINYHYTDTAGNGPLNSGSCTIPANSAIGQFLDQAVPPCAFNSGGFQGTFTFTSNVPVSAIALRSFVTEDGSGTLYSTLPVVDTSAATGVNPVFLAHFADGTDGVANDWGTQVVLINPTSNTLTGSIQFIGQGPPAAAVSMATDKATATSFNYSIPAESSYILKTSGLSNPTVVGSVQITPSGGASAPSAMLIFTHRQLPSGLSDSEAGVPSVQGTAFRMYYEISGSGAGAVSSAVAISNTTSTDATINFEAYNLDGSFFATGQSQPLPANGHYQTFVNQLFPGQTLPSRGILRIFGATPTSVVGIRFRNNELHQLLFTTTPATSETAATLPAGTESYFPRLVNGLGWTSQYVLFSGAAGQATTGQVEFVDYSGNAITLILQ